MNECNESFSSCYKLPLNIFPNHTSNCFCQVQKDYFSNELGDSAEEDLLAESPVKIVHDFKSQHPAKCRKTSRPKDETHPANNMVFDFDEKLHLQIQGIPARWHSIQ